MEYNLFRKFIAKFIAESDETRSKQKAVRSRGYIK
jgi:hypothetical protein|tara:strand:+ start:22 stop:126 length:105 start_codon:yes stop_codon:yes gene_type:complete